MEVYCQSLRTSAERDRPGSQATVSIMWTSSRPVDWASNAAHGSRSRRFRTPSRDAEGLVLSNIVLWRPEMGASLWSAGAFQHEPPRTNLRCRALELAAACDNTVARRRGRTHAGRPGMQCVLPVVRQSVLSLRDKSSAPPHNPEHVTAGAGSTAVMAKSPSLLPYALPSRARILLTGSTGCIGSHIAVELLTHTDCTLELLVRGGTLRFVAEADEALRNGVELGRVHVHDVDLAAGQGLENEQLRTIVGICDALILCAASWGGDTAHAVNVASVLATIRAVNKRRCRKIVYFSTASVIAPQGRLLIQEAIRWGTDYIRSKAIALVELVKAMSDISETPVSLTIVFPTLVLGRRSHIGKALDTDAAAKMNHSPLYRGAKYALRFMHMESAIRAHFIHAADCAQVVRRLLFCVVSASFKTLDKIDLTPPTLVPSVQQPSQTAYLVLGQQPPFSYDDVVRALCRLYGLRVPSRWLRIPADPLLWLMVHRLIPVDPWTRYCLRRRRELFVFPQAVRPEDFGGISVAPDLYTALEQSRTRFTAEQSTREISSAI